MKLKQAEAIVTLYQELIESIPRDKLIAQPRHTTTKIGGFTLNNLVVEDQYIVAHWSHYLERGESDHATTCHQLAELFED